MNYRKRKKTFKMSIIRSIDKAVQTISRDKLIIVKVPVQGDIKEYFSSIRHIRDQLVRIERDLGVKWVIATEGLNFYEDATDDEIDDMIEKLIEEKARRKNS